MATTNDEGFNSLDPLGPEFGKINAPLVDSKGLSAFEGDRLEMPKINFPEPQRFTPVIPNISSLDSPQPNVRQNLVGSPPNKPGINKKASFNEIRNAINSDLRAKLQTNQDKNSYAKVYAYDAGPDGNAFYKRYQAYGQDKFDQIGFSPLRDNESLFNEHTTWWDDHKRMMTNSFWPLFGRGFISGPKSLGKMLMGDFTGTDIADAAAYKEAAAIGQSSKKGFGSFVNNGIMNFGYSVGIMSEAALEEVGLALLTVGTEGAFAPAFFARTAQNLKRFGSAITGLDFATDGLRAVNSSLDAASSLNGARNFWEKARTVGKIPFSPVGSTVRAYEAAKGIDNLTNLGLAYKTAGGFYRDVVRINMALSEARLEGGQVENQIYDNLYNQHYNKTGEAPSNELQHDMIKQSKKGALNTVLWNTALIYGSNAITFPNIMGPKGGIKGFLENSIKEFQTIKGGKYGDLGKIMYNKASKKIEFQANTFKNMIKSYGSQPLHKAGLGTLGYFKANFTEGIQENLQEVISGANEKYYTDTFASKALGSFEYSKAVSKYNTASQLDYFGKGLSDQFTAQGFETFASGFAMGALATPVNAAFKNLSIGYNRMFNKEAYNEFKTEKLRITKDLVNQLNSVDIQEFLDSKTFNYAVQEGVANVKEKGSVREANDADLEGIVSQMEHLYNNGTTSIFKDKMKAFSQMTPEEFEEAVPTVPKGEGAKYLAKIPNTLKKLDQIENDYNEINKRYPNPVNESTLPPKDSPEYADAIALHHGWRKAVQNAVYFKQAFNDTLIRKRDIMAKYLSQAPLKGMTQRDSEVIFDHNKLRDEAAMLKEEVATLKDLKDPESQRQFATKQRKLEALTKLGEKTVQFSNFFNRYEKAAAIRTELEKQNGGEPVTDEQVQQVMDDIFGEFTDENKTQVFSEHESAYKDYLKALAEVNGDFIFDKDVDESYELLADHYKLGAEGNKLMKYVNLLHDPNAFMEAADRNRKWMKGLYDKRGDIYEKMIKEQLNLVIDNALLNQLANKGVYLSLDDFAQWKKDGTPPSEFFDNTRKMIIPEGTTEYDKYYMFFEQASELKDQSTGTIRESLDQALKTRLDEIDQQMAEAIDKVPKKEVKVPVETLKAENGVLITLTQVFNKLKPGQYAENVYGEDAEFPLIVYKDDEGNLRLDGPEGEIFKNLNAAIAFLNSDIYTLSEQADPELVAPIKEQFEALKNKTREDYADRVEEVKKAEEGPIQEFVPITNDVDSISQYPGLYNTLYGAFEKKVLQKMDPEDFVNLTEEQEMNLFNKFLQTDKDAKAEIDSFNKKQKLEDTTKETGEKGEFEFMYQGNKKNTVDIKTVLELRKMQRRFKALIEDIDSKEEPTAEDMTNKSKYKILVTDFEKLIATRSKKGLTPQLQAAIDKINSIKDKQGEVSITEDGISVNGEEYQTASIALGIEETSTPFKEYIDEQVKNLFDLEGAPKIDETKITQEAYDNLFGDKGYLTKLKQRVDNGELFIVSQGLTVYDSKSKMASTIDLLVADANSNLTIVAVTPDSKSNWDVFKKKENPKSKMNEATRLQTANATLLKSMIGEDVNIAVLPIEMSVTTTDNKILTANKPTTTSLLATDFLIGLNKAEAQAEIDQLIPTEKQTVTPTSNIEAQREAIERKKKESIDSIKEGYNGGKIWIYTSEFSGEFPSTNQVSQDNYTKEQLISEIEKTYDAELAALGSTTSTDIAAKKADIERKINNLPDNLLFITHITSQGNAKNIFNDNLLMPAGVSSTTGIINKAQLKQLLFDLADGKSPHRGYLDLFLGAIDKSTLENTNGKSLQDKLENYLDENFIEDTAKTQLPSSLNIGYFTDGVLNTKYDPSVVPANAESSDDVESPAVEAGKKEREVTVIDDSLRYRVSDFKADLTKVNTPAELKALLGELSIKNAEQLISFEDLQQMAAMAKTKAEELNTPENVKLAPESLAVGSQLVAKNTIFTQAGKEDNVFAETDDTVIVKSVDKAKKTVTISPLNSDSKITLSFNELGKSFTLKDVVMDAKESTDQKVTPEDQNKINESTDLADNFVQNKTGRLDEIEGQASVKSLEELDEELLEDIEC